MAAAGLCAGRVRGRAHHQLKALRERLDDLGARFVFRHFARDEVHPFAVRAAVTITDQSGQTTYGTVGQDYNDDGLTDSSLNFCGATGDTPGFAVEDTVPLGTAEIIVFPHALPGLGNDAFLGNPQPCGGVGTAGTVTVTWFFS